MNSIFRVAICASSILYTAGTSFAQTTLVAGPVSDAVLRTGTPVAMKTNVLVTTKDKKARIGDRIPLEVSEPVRFNGQTVIPAGTPGMAEITEVRNKGMWGKSGHVTLRILYLRVGDRQIRLSGSIDDKGVTGTAGVVAAIALIPIAGFFTTGTSAEIPSGSSIKAFIDEDVPVAGAPPVAPLTAVVAPAPIAVVTPVSAVVASPLAPSPAPAAAPAAAKPVASR